MQQQHVMVALYYQIPFKKDIVQKILQENQIRGKEISLQLIAELEGQGLACQLAEINAKYYQGIEPIAVIIFKGNPVILYKPKSNSIIIGDPRTGILETSEEELLNEYTGKIQFVLPRRDETHQHQDLDGHGLLRSKEI